MKDAEDLEYAVDFGGKRGVEQVATLPLAKALARIEPNRRILFRTKNPWEPLP